VLVCVPDEQAAKLIVSADIVNTNILFLNRIKLFFQLIYLDCQDCTIKIPPIGKGKVKKRSKYPFFAQITYKT